MKSAGCMYVNSPRALTQRTAPWSVTTTVCGVRCVGIVVALAGVWLSAAACGALTPQAQGRLAFITQAPRASTSGLPPLLILLHGFGADERDLMPMAQQVDPRLAIVSARAPIVLPSGGYAWFSGGDGGAEFEDSRRRAVAFVDNAVEAVGADPRRVFVAGFSQGAMVSLAMALTAPDRIAGAVALSGRLLPGVAAHYAAADRLRGLPLLVIHGTEDQTVPIRFGRELRDTLPRFSLRLDYRELPVGHIVAPAEVDALSAWLSARLDE